MELPNNQPTPAGTTSAPCRVQPNLTEELIKVLLCKRLVVEKKDTASNSCSVDDVQKQAGSSDIDSSSPSWLTIHDNRIALTYRTKIRHFQSTSQSNENNGHPRIPIRHYTHVAPSIEQDSGKLFAILRKHYGVFSIETVRDI